MRSIRRSPAVTPQPSDRPRLSHAIRRGIALAEVLMATALTAASAGTLLVSIAASCESSEWTMRRTIATGLAEQLLIELHGVPFDSSWQPPHDCSYQSGRAGRCTLDAHDHWSASPPQNRCGAPVGAGRDGDCGYYGSPPPTRSVTRHADATRLARFRRAIRVEPIAEVAGSWVPATTASAFRRVTVRVRYRDGTGSDHMLVELTEVFVDAAN